MHLHVCVLYIMNTSFMILWLILPLKRLCTEGVRQVPVLLSLTTLNSRPQA